MKKLVTLQFPSFDALWRFKSSIKAHCYVVRTRATLFTSPCTDQEVQAARLNFGATLLKQEEGCILPVSGLAVPEETDKCSSCKQVL